MRRRSTTPIIVSLAITLVMVGSYFVDPPVIGEHVETLLVDFRFKVRNFISPPEVPEDILVVAIDEKSLSRHGRWPWSRDVQAQLVEKVMEGEPKAAAVDIFYSERENEVCDAALASVFNRYRDRIQVALCFECEEGKRFAGDVDDRLWDHTLMRVENRSLYRPVEAFRVLYPPEPIGGASVFGHVYSLPDRDGKLRWEYSAIKYGDEYFPSLAVRTVIASRGISIEDIYVDGARGLVLGDWKVIPTDIYGRMHINYLGKENSFTTLSAADVLAGAIPEDTFEDKIVFIGASAIGTYDLKVTPMSANMTGVEKNATVAANILQGNFIRMAPWYGDVTVIVFFGVAALLFGRGLSARRFLLIYLALLVLLLVSNQGAFSLAGMRMNLVYPLGGLLFNGTFLTSYRYFVEEKHGREVRKMFSSYVTERVVNELIENPDMAKLGGVRREVTILFADIRDFTSYSEKNHAEEVVKMLNQYLAAMTDVVFRWEGTLDKFIGDGIIAFWNAPVLQEDHVERAMKCALHMANRLEELNRIWLADGKAEMRMGIGLNTGEVVVGNIGAEARKVDYTVVGDHVNLAARVESMTRQYDTDILITESTFDGCRESIGAGRLGHLEIIGMDEVMVKGKEKPVQIYTVKPLDEGEKIHFGHRDKVNEKSGVTVV